MIPTTTAPSAASAFTPPEAEDPVRSREMEESVVVEAEDDGMQTLAPRLEPPRSSTAVDVAPDANPGPKRKTSFWSKLSRAATVVEEHLAEWFGLNDSKYQWAVDEAMNRRLAGESQEKPAPSEATNKVQTEPASQQTMHVSATPISPSGLK